MLLPVLVVFAFMGESFFWVVLTGIFHFTAKLLGGNGRFEDLMILTGFSKMPILIVNVILFPISLALRGILPISQLFTIFVIISFCGRIYESYLLILSTSMNHNLSRWKSIICVVPPEFILGLIYVAFSGVWLYVR